MIQLQGTEVQDFWFNINM